MNLRGHMLVGAAVAALALAAPLPGAGEAAAQGRTIWEGFHVGAHAGWSRSDYDVSTSGGAPGLAAVDDSASGFIGGVHYGTSWQFNQWVVGTDSDFSWVDGDAGPNVVAGGNFANLDTKWTSSTRLRAGHLLGHGVLLYGTVGLAAAKVEATGTLIASGKESKRIYGVQYGLGLETTLPNRWYARVEYLRSDYRSKSVAATGGGTFDYDLDSDVVRAAVGYRFDWSPLDLLRR